MDFDRQVHLPSFGLSSNGDARKPSYKWQRVLLKVSGEALAGDNAQNIDPKVGKLPTNFTGFIVFLFTFSSVLCCSNIGNNGNSKGGCISDKAWRRGDFFH